MDPITFSINPVVAGILLTVGVLALALITAAAVQYAKQRKKVNAYKQKREAAAKKKDA